MEHKIDGQLLKLMLSSATNNLINHKKYLNDLNVFPVPDGDTGTNMGKTFEAANVAAQAVLGESPTDVLDALATASLRGARGNSGVILSQITRGFAKAAHVMSVANGDAAPVSTNKTEQKNRFAIMRCMKFGADTAYRAVMKPTEGTILTVAREMAEFAEANYNKFDNATDYFAAILQAGKESLARTPEMLPQLKQAGVVDAGGAGLIILIEGAVYALQNGAEIPLQAEMESSVTTVATFKSDIDIKFAYCTEFIIVKNLNAETIGAKQFEALIEPKGDSIVVIEDDEIIKVHIHTNNPGAVMEHALKLGELTDIKIDNMRFQAEDVGATVLGRPQDTPIGEPKEYGFVAVSTGDGIDGLFSEMGVDIIVSGGQTMNPSTQDILDAIEKVNSATVYVLPNNKNIILAAEQAAELTEKTVAVILTKSIPEGLAAMFAFDSEGEVEQNRENMTDSASLIKTGYVTFAARDSEIDGLIIKENDIMGLCGNQVKVVGASPSEICEQVVELLCDDDCGSISLYYGSDVSENEAEELQAKLEDKFSLCDVMVYKGNQPLYYYIISVE